MVEHWNRQATGANTSAAPCALAHINWNTWGSSSSVTKVRGETAMTTPAIDYSDFAQVTHNHLVWPALAFLGFLAANVASTVISLFWL